MSRKFRSNAERDSTRHNLLILFIISPHTRDNIGYRGWWNYSKGLSSKAAALDREGEKRQNTAVLVGTAEV
jgi:hypothetical protein